MTTSTSVQSVLLIGVIDRILMCHVGQVNPLFDTVFISRCLQNVSQNSTLILTEQLQSSS